METRELRTILQHLRDGDVTIDDVLERLRHLPFEDIGCASIDHHRALRQGFPEVVFGESKSVEQIERIVGALSEKGNNVLVTRLAEDKALRVTRSFPTARYHSDARCLTIEQKPVEMLGKGKILVISAGTSDIPVAAEAVLTAGLMGNEVEQLFDVGVAGIHRLLGRKDSPLLRLGPDSGGRHGGRSSLRGRRHGKQAGDSGAHVGRLRGLIRRHRGPAGDAQFLRLRGHRGQHRQRVRRGICGESDE